jgi:hypothetical protein
MEDVLAPWLHMASNQRFQLVIAGRISGVHDWQGTHRPIACQMNDATLTIQFDGSERLTISNVGDIIMLPNNELVIRDADEARFSWYSHGDSQNNPTLCEEVFRKAGRGMWFSRTGIPFATSGFLKYASENFIVLRQV